MMRISPNSVKDGPPDLRKEPRGACLIRAAFPLEVSSGRCPLRIGLVASRSLTLGGQFRRRPPAVRRRDRQLADGGHADDDGRRPETAGVCVATPRLEPVRGCDAHHRTEADLSFPIRRWNVRSVRVADDLLGTGKTPLQSRTSPKFLGPKS